MPHHRPRRIRIATIKNKTGLPTVGGAILLENGQRVLLENGFVLLKEDQ